MFKKSRIDRLRRILALEALEDRTLLSGNVSVFQAIATGQVIIFGDGGNHAYLIRQTNLFGGPALSITGSSFANPIVPGNVTAINNVPGGTVSFPLASVSSLQITEGNGTNCVQLNGFSLPGNISITVGTGVDKILISNVQASGGVISVTAPPGSGSSDTVSETNVVAGASLIATGNGNATITQTNVTFGFDSITTGTGADTISVTASMNHPPPRTYAIGQLAITSSDGNDAITVDHVDVGNATLSAGGGKNTIKFDNSLIQTAMITNGSSAGAGTTSLDFSNNVITGAFVTINLLNAAGIGGSNFFGGAGSIYHVTMDNVMFTGGGNLSLTVDDGVPYVANVNGTQTLQEASTVEMMLVDTAGTITVNLGNHFQSVKLGAGTIGLNDLDASALTVNIGNDNDIVVVSANIIAGGKGNEVVTIGDVTTAAIGGAAAPPPSVLINGIWNTDGGQNVTINLGNNNNPNLTSGWPVTVQETTGALTIQGINGSFPFFGTGGNGIALNVVNTTASGPLTINLGNGGATNFQSINLQTVVAKDIFITINSLASQMPDGSPFGAYITLNNVRVTDTTPNFNGNLQITDTGAGTDIVNLTNVSVVYDLAVLLSRSGTNVLSAQNVTAAFGMINGGGGASIYEDLGGNFGYFVTNFLGHP